MDVVLLVTPDSWLREILSGYLRHYGREAVMARDALEAGYLVARYGPRIKAVVSDYSLPTINGLELAVEIRRAYPHVKVVVLFDSMSLEPPPASIDFLLKPFRLQALSARLGGAVYARAT